VVIVDVVLETESAVDFTAWPVAKPSSDRLLVVSGRMSAVEVGTAMAVIFSYNGISVEPVTSLTKARLEQHLAEAGALIAPGGLRFRDPTTGVELAPGCCFGLENWRDWWDVARGQEPWLGHAPSPQLDQDGQVIRLWQNDRDSSPVHTIEFTSSELHSLLASAQRQLGGFLELVQRWATDISPGLADGLITVLDEHLRINAPLPS
jgi:hypothetical protein